MLRKRLVTKVKRIITLVLTVAVSMQVSSFALAGDGARVELDVSNTDEWFSGDGRFVYPFTPERSEWEELDTYREKVEACKIPPQVLKCMSDEQLLQAVIDYPLIYDVFFFSDVKEGVDHFTKTCDAYAELVERKDAKDILFAGVIDQNRAQTINRMEDGGDLELLKMVVKDEIVLDTLIALTIFQQKIGEQLTDEEVVALIEASTFPTTMALDEVVGVMMTPNGSVVNYYLFDCYHPENVMLHKIKDAEIVKTYGVNLVSDGSCRYNCHSYAWYNQSSNNKRWINNPSPYMEDGSYTRVMSGNINTNAASVNAGDIVVYGGLSHSAIVEGGANGGPIATRTLVSKWGTYGVFRHRATQVPSSYDVNEISVWRR